MSVMFHPAVFEQVDEEIESYSLSETRFSGRYHQNGDIKQRCACYFWVSSISGEKKASEHINTPHSVCLPSMNPVIRIAFWLNHFESAS